MVMLMFAELMRSTLTDGDLVSLSLSLSETASEDVLGE